MAYKYVVDTLRDISEDINPNGTFIHARRWDFSVDYDKPFPQVHLYPIQTEVNTDNAVIERHSILLGFAYQDTPESSNEEREGLIEKADILCRSFIAELLNGEGYETINFRSEPFYRDMSGTLSGYLLRFTMITSESIC